MTDIGRDFEKEFAEEFGLEQVPGSGNQWHSKLDVKGMGVRWSLKATQNMSFPLNSHDIYEAHNYCVGIGGPGDIPLMAIRLNADTPLEIDLIVMRKEDFAAIVTERKTLFIEDKTQSKRRHASIPELMRDS